MPIVPLTPLATPPDPNDRSTFEARAYPFTVSQQTMVGEFNANVSALNAAATAASGAIAASHYKGAWSTLTGQLAIPATVTHGADPTLYMLLESVADVTLEEPGVSNKWKSLAPIAPRTPVFSVLTASGSYTVPGNVFTIRGYAIGKGGNGGATFGASATNSNGGGGGGMAYGDIAVTPGQVLQISIVSGVAKLIVDGVDYLVGNPGGNGGATGGAGGTATKHANVTNGGAYSGGLGGTGATASYGGFGGGSAASPLGNGFPGAVSPEHNASSGAGIGGGVGYYYGGGGGAGGGGVSFQGGGAGGAATENTPGPGRSLDAAYTDPILRHMVCPGGWAYNNQGANAPGPGGGGAFATYRGGNGGDGGGGGGAASNSGVEVRGGDGGFLGGGGGAVNTATSAIVRAYGGNGGIGGGGGGAHAAYTGANYATAGTGGPAAVLIYA